MKRTGFFARAIALVAAPFVAPMIAALPAETPEITELEPMMVRAPAEDEFLEIRIAGMDGSTMRWANRGWIPLSQAERLLTTKPIAFAQPSAFAIRAFWKPGPWAEEWADRFELVSHTDGIVVFQGRLDPLVTPRGWPDDFMGSWLTRDPQELTRSPLVPR